MRSTVIARCLARGAFVLWLAWSVERGGFSWSNVPLSSAFPLLALRGSLVPRPSGQHLRRLQWRLGHLHLGGLLPRLCREKDGLSARFFFKGCDSCDVMCDKGKISVASVKLTGRHQLTER